MKFCEKCGCVNDSINNYCRSCGAPFIAAEQAAAPERDEEERQKHEITLPELDPEIFKKEAEDETAPELSNISENPELSEMYNIPDPKPVIDFDFGGGEEETDGNLKENPTDDNLYENQTGEKLYSTHPVINILKKVGASGTFLSFCIIFSSFYIASFISFLSESVSLITGDISIAPLSLLFIPSGLMLIGFWAHFASSSNRERNWLSTSGLSLVQAGCIINIVISSFAFFIFMGNSLISLTSTLFYKNFSSVYLNIVLIYALATAISIIMIIYFSFATATVGRLKKCAANGAPVKMPMFIIVINYIAAVALSPGIGYFLATEDVLSLICVVLLILSLVFLSGVMISYRTGFSEVSQ